MSIYSSFFTPQTISILFCLHQTVKQTDQINPKSPIIQFLVKKILKLTQQSNVQVTNQGFEAQMLSIVNDIDFVQQYREILEKIDSFNNFYRQLSIILKSLRSFRNSKLQQGNVVDFLVRRLYIYFEKLDFKQIVNIYENFQCYREGRPYSQRQHEFMLTKSIEQLKFNLQNYQLKQNPEQIAKILKNLAQNDHTFKTSYVKGLYKAEQKKPNQSMHQLHRYFDRCLGNLFQQKTQTTPMSNKINHCIISTAYSNLKMGHLEECLQAISEGLRISQNNSDQQSINNCIIYLYKIAEQLGKYQQQILLAQHAITHSLNLTNIILMVYSCLCYSSFQKKYNCQNSQVTLLKSRHINWTDALHFSKKKIYSNFESNCKNIYHSFRNLLIPSFLHKLSVLIHVPELKKLLLNPYYNRKQLYDLEVFQQYLGNTSKIDKQLKQANRYLMTSQASLLSESYKRLKNLQKEADKPQNIIKIKSFICKMKINQGVDMDCYKEVEGLIATCKKYGFVKSYLVEAYNFIHKILIENELYYDALVKIEQTIKFCEDNELSTQKVNSHLLKAQIHCYLGNINEAFEIVQQTEEQGILEKLQIESLILFEMTKLMLCRRLAEILQRDINFIDETNQIKSTALKCLNNLLRYYITQGSLSKTKKIIKQLWDFSILNPQLIDKNLHIQQKSKQIISYIEKVEHFYVNISNSNLQNEQFDEEAIHLKIMKKIHNLYFA